MVVGLVRARVLLCRALARDVPLPLPGETVAAWTTRLCAMLAIDGHACVPVAPRDDSWWDPNELDELCLISPARARELLAVHAEGLLHQRTTGTFYTADDVSEFLARSCLEPSLVAPSAVPSALLSARQVSGAGQSGGQLTVLDPTCGSGAFLRAAAAYLDGQPGATQPAAMCMFGVDINAVAVESCRWLLLADAVERWGGEVMPVISRAVAANIVVGDAVTAPRWQHWFPTELAAGGFGAVLSNPPYIRQRAAFCGNTSAVVARDALTLTQPGGRVGLVVPVSTICTDAFAPLRSELDDTCSRVWVASFDAVPSTLFPGTVQRIALVIAQRALGSSTSPAAWAVTRYHRWRASERFGLLDRICWVARPSQSVGGSIAKIGTQVEVDLLDRVFAHAPASELFATGNSRAGAPEQLSFDADHPNQVFYKRRWSYFLLFTNFMPYIEDNAGNERAPTEFKALDIVPAVDARVLIAVYASSLFWWYFGVFSDNRNVNRRELAAFRVQPARQRDRRRARRGLPTSSCMHCVSTPSCAPARTSRSARSATPTSVRPALDRCSTASTTCSPGITACRWKNAPSFSSTRPGSVAATARWSPSSCRDSPQRWSRGASMSTRMSTVIGSS